VELPSNGIEPRAASVWPEPVPKNWRRNHHDEDDEDDAGSDGPGTIDDPGDQQLQHEAPNWKDKPPPGFQLGMARPLRDAGKETSSGGWIYGTADTASHKSQVDTKRTWTSNRAEYPWRPWRKGSMCWQPKAAATTEDNQDHWRAATDTWRSRVTAQGSARKTPEMAWQPKVKNSVVQA